MNWWVKLFVPKHERPIIEIAENCENVFKGSTKYSFMDKHGNGFEFFINDDSPSLLAFLVDGIRVEGEGTHKMSGALTMYLTTIADKKHQERMKEYDAQNVEAFVKAIHMYGARTKK